MSAKHNTARMRSLATDLVDLRVAAGLNTREAAKLVGMSASTLNRLENGGKTIEPEHVSALCVAYGVTGSERERLLALSREPHMPGWWETSGEPIPTQLSALIRFESEAIRIIHAAMLLIPGLLQTAEYCRAIMSAAGVVGSTREARVAARLGRQAILSKPKPPAYVAFLDEAALRRPFGDGPLMVAQLRHIIELTAKPNVDVRVIPFAAGLHTGLDGSYIVLDFAKGRSLVHLEHKRSSLYLDQPEDVAPFQAATDTLAAAALGPQDSVDFLRSVAADYDKG